MGTEAGLATSNSNVTGFRRVVIGALVVAMVAAGCSSHSPSPHLSSRTTTTEPGPPTTAPHPSAGLSAAQLGAHLGAGAPAGWVPVDQGDARLFVPKAWTLEANGSCIGGGFAGMISVGSLPNTSCDQTEQVATPDQAVALIPSAQPNNGQPSLVVHGYRVYDVVSNTPGWSFFDVPQLGVRIATHGTLGTRIIETLAPSGRKVALNAAYEIVPDNWRTVDEDGMSLSIPRGWSVVTPGALCGAPVGNSELLLIEPRVLFAPCPFKLPTAADAAHDAVALYLTSHNPNSPTPTGRAIAHLRYGATVTTIYPEVDDPNALDLFVHRAGSGTAHVLILGLGSDGRVAGGVLASLRAGR